MMMHGRSIDGEMPECLVVPGLDGSGPDHWQTLWEHQRNGCRRVELGNWNDPALRSWVARLDRAIGDTARPPILVAHSLGCLAVAWWAEHAGERASRQVAGALLVAPPDVDRADRDPRLARFAPTPARPLPFAASLVASRNDPYATIDRSRVMAETWGARLIDLGEAGHINAQSKLGAWAEGQRLLDELVAVSDAPTCRRQAAR